MSHVRPYLLTDRVLAISLVGLAAVSGLIAISKESALIGAGAGFDLAIATAWFVSQRRDRQTNSRD